MKHLWLQDEKDIYLEIERLIQERVRLVCGRRGIENPTWLEVKGLVQGEDGNIVVLFYPSELTCPSPSCTFYYRPAGEQMRSFNAQRIKKADCFLGLQMPTQIFQVCYRKQQRVEGGGGSSLRFVWRNKGQIFEGAVGNISSDGCKIVGDFPARLQKANVLKNLMLILFAARYSGREWRLHIPRASIVWSKADSTHTEAFGVRFFLTGYPRQVLSEYIDLRLIEEAL